MSYVKDTVLLSSEVFSGVDGTTWKELVIAGREVSFEPGQFLMVAPVCSAGVSWPSPLMIQHCSPKGYVAWVHPNSPLYALRAGDAVTVWGPNGKSVPVKEEFAVLCDAKGLMLVAPVLRAWADRCQGLYLVGEYCGVDLANFAGGVAAKAIDSFENVAGFPNAQSLVVALPLGKLAQWKDAVPQPEGQTVVFVGAQIGCGVGACRGCYIHSGPYSTGVAVCQEGPFMPIEAVDYVKDQNFLGHYV